MQEKPCSKCKEVKPLSAFPPNKAMKDGHDSWCKECRRVAYKAYRDNNVEKRRAVFKKWYENNREYNYERSVRYRAEHAEEISNKRKQYYRENREAALLYAQEYAKNNPGRSMEYYHRNREHILNRDKKRRERNPDRYNEYWRLYRERYPEKTRAIWHRYYTARKAGGSFSGEEWRLLCDWFGNVCLCCGEARPLTVDHVIPVSKGGRNTIDNLQPLCRSCNPSKGNRHDTDYRDPDKLAAFLDYLKTNTPDPEQ
jgi:5-methylcytosine-specific restriction endonuclease McrA